jgi:hypothetical protein
MKQGKVLTKKEAYARIMSKIGSPCKFKYPRGSHPQGYLRDRVALWGSKYDDVDYWDVVDLLEFPQEPKRYWIRISYYRVDTRLYWAGQYSISEPIDIMKRILKQANKRMKNWSLPVPKLSH